MSSDKIRPERNQQYNNFYDSCWCKQCTSKHFQNDFNKWTSGNDKIDKFFQDAQLNANNRGFGTIHYIMDRLENEILNNGKDTMAIHLKIYGEFASIRFFFGITQNPETQSYMMVLDYAKDRNLREIFKN
ncbi:hypothetical protein Glove_50g52 [Diversispora epigaea]|uniref:Protein kinase domain-containing protein n=1 Tax=Diversispora epigaea TaxID=1348612 RepID=A0A397JH01_9GLOM|nr:hypothetical protein Glove_50g52 [Diversispora epigaea]